MKLTNKPGSGGFKKVKKGINTSEFWLSAGACGLTLLLASGLIGEHTAVHTVAGLLLTSLTALGYTCARTALKIKK